tara:strand:+ start:722 stop:892 length:171 start_codon:yes stop_codon:yes gene_type:complete
MSDLPKSIRKEIKRTNSPFIAYQQYGNKTINVRCIGCPSEKRAGEKFRVVSTIEKE